jgi:hypothetical protein
VVKADRLKVAIGQCPAVEMGDPLYRKLAAAQQEKNC